MKKNILTILCFIALLSQLSVAANHYVSLTGSNIFPFLLWDTAATNIQSAVDAASDGETVIIAHGTYYPTNSILITNAIIVMGESEAELTIIDGGSPIDPAKMHVGFYIENTGAYVKYLTIRNNHRYVPGGGIHIKNGGNVSDCIIINNRTDGGSGIYCENGGLVENCIIKGNYVWSGMTTGGGIAIYSNGIVRSCLITENSAGVGGGVSLDNGGLIENCTVCSNFADSGGGIVGFETGLVRNTIVYFNSLPNHTNFSGNCIFEYCCIFPTNYLMGSVKCTDENPQFDIDYHLLQISSCVDTGTNMPWMVTAVDLSGNPRISPVAGNVDIGAYEYIPEPVCVFLFFAFSIFASRIRNRLGSMDILGGT